MASDQSFVDYVAEQVGLGERLTHKRMFGEYALYLDGKVVGFVCDNSLFVKPTPAATALAPQLPLRPPYPGAKDYPVADELLDEPPVLQRLLHQTAEALPPPKPKKPKAPPKPRASRT
ncbi:TfoX/Sxy family protein [Roseateles sp. BYS180W]|uniref:TfoX/Sxy family protein n=1 Tax=Roseateles rivi TaxID=3299028 RepID=A0ABW7FU61_9BURK